MYKRRGHNMHGQRRSAPSSSSSPANGQHGHIGPSSDPQEHIRRQRTESPQVPPSSEQHSNNEGNLVYEEDIRFVICPFGDSFTDATYVVRQLNKIINNSWRGQCVSYSSAPREINELWWNEFKRKFTWDETEDDEIRRIFKKKGGDHIRTVMNKAKTSRVKPAFISGDHWAEIQRTWETENNRQINERNKKNPASSSSEGSGSASATYAGGSINIAEHKKRLADELETEPTYASTFEHTFQKKDKTWTGDRAKAIKWW